MTGSATAAARRSGCSRSSLDSSGALRHVTVSHAFSTGMPTSRAARMAISRASPRVRATPRGCAGWKRGSRRTHGTMAPELVADAFPFEQRGRALSIFFAAIPVGSAAGYILGDVVNQHFGWRAAFWIAGAPGVLLAMLLVAVKDPPRGLQDAAFQ